MEFTTLEIAGADAIRVLDEYRSRYSVTGLYPFLIGDAEQLELIEETAEDNEQDLASIIQASVDVDVTDWLAERRKEAEENEFSDDEMLGEWSGEVLDKGSIGLHKDVLSGVIKPTVIFGLAPIEKPWHLPAVLKYGGWNACPEAEMHCAFHRYWLDKYGAEITGMSGAVVECTVKSPPTDRDRAIDLAWEQYWYCTDIVDQGCGSISNLAATLLNSPYWYFWWD